MCGCVCLLLSVNTCWHIAMYLVRGAQTTSVSVCSLIQFKTKTEGSEEGKGELHFKTTNCYNLHLKWVNSCTLPFVVFKNITEWGCSFFFSFLRNAFWIIRGKKMNKSHSSGIVFSLGLYSKTYLAHYCGFNHNRHIFPEVMRIDAYLMKCLLIKNFMYIFDLMNIYASLM